VKKLAAEFIGTFALVFAGTGAIVVNEASGGVITHVGIALTFGLTVLTMIYTLGDISGAHINPAVTIAFWAARRFSARQVGPYVLSQCAGALTASLSLRLLFPQNAMLGSTVPAGPAAQSFILEGILTAGLMFVILGVSTGAREKGITAGIVVGSVIALEALFAGPICGASMNPARSLAPAIVSGHLETLWIYLVAPTLGACTGVLACRCVREEDCCSNRLADRHIPSEEYSRRGMFSSAAVKEERRREIVWAVVRLALGLIQIVGATASVLLLISTGPSRLTLFAVIVTGLFTLGSRILFSPRKR
jgi:aquaporin Z